MEPTPQHNKYIGKIYWITPPIQSKFAEMDCSMQCADVPRAIMIGNEFHLGWKRSSEGGIKLNTTDRLTYEGQFNYESEGRVTGIATAQIYFNNSGCILMGIWKEEGVNYSWIAELKTIDKFDDEKI